MVKKNILGILASSVLLFTSCLGESDPEAYCAGYFTIQSNANSTDVVLYMDGGGTFYPTSSTVYDATDGKGFGSVKRAYFILYYPENLITYDADKNIIAKQVSINSGEYLPLADPLTVEEALEKNLLENDSLNEMASMSRIWAYKGYLTNIYASKYVIQSNMGVRPTLNMTLKPSELHPGEMDATFLLNQHIKSEKDVVSSDTYTFSNSFDLTPFANEFLQTGLDSVTVNVTCKGIKDFSFKVSTKDVVHSFK